MSPSTSPWAPPANVPNLGALVDLLRDRSVVVLAGAGCSTESGIPDYRGPQGRLKTRSPIQYGEFVRDPNARRRYWARSTVGWRRIATARPNSAHVALARLEAGRVVSGIITQNVDGLHHAAGSRRVIELHGSLASVRCLSCRTSVPRHAFQRRLLEVNRIWLEVDGQRSRRQSAAPAPDGDAELAEADLEGFEVPECDECGGVFKPDVVFFGESVPPDRVQGAWRLFEEADVLLVVGSSLQVFSGRRFVYRATRDGVPIAIVNLGRTRVDGLAAAKVEGRVGEVLPALAVELLQV